MKSFSFVGCAWLMIYHFGVAETLLKEEYLTHQSTLLGASSGSVIAAFLATATPLSDAREALFECLLKSQSHFLGPLRKITPYLHAALNELLPPDAHTKVEDRLHISITQLKHRKPYLNNVLINQFQSRDELITYLLASCYIPVVYKKSAIYQGKLYLDGGFSNNTPILDDNTVVVSPYIFDTQHATIQPSTPLKRVHALFPPNKKHYQYYFNLGRQAAEQFLKTTIV